MTRSSLPAVPTGLTELLALFPPINRWAILTGPSGTQDEDLNWWQEISDIVLFVLAGSVGRTRG